MVDYSEYMNKPLGEMKRVLLPKGHYFGRIRKIEPKDSSNNKPMLNVQFALDSAGEDVDASTLPPAGVAGKVVSVNYMMAEDFGQDGIREMVKAVIPTADDAQPWGQYIPQLDNQPVKLYVDHRRREKDDPNSEMMEDIKKVLPAA